MIRLLLVLIALLTYGFFASRYILVEDSTPSSQFWWTMITLFFAGWGISDMIDKLFPPKRG